MECESGLMGAWPPAKVHPPQAMWVQERAVTQGRVPVLGSLGLCVGDWSQSGAARDGISL